MENQSVAQKLEALVKLQYIDTKLDELKKLRGDLPTKFRTWRTKLKDTEPGKASTKQASEEIEENIKKHKEAIKEAEKLIKKYTEQQKNVRNNREFDAITKEIELQELEIQICEKKIKEGKRANPVKRKKRLKRPMCSLRNAAITSRTRKKNLTASWLKVTKKRKGCLAEREKAAKKIEDKLLKYYERLRGSLSNGLAVVRVVRGAAEGCNIVIPPQKIAEIREKKKIVIDEHSGRILADVDMDSLDEGDKPKTAKVATPAPSRRKKAE